MSMKRVMAGLSCVAAALLMGVQSSVIPAAAQSAQQSAPKTHWEPYRNRNSKPSVDQQLQDPALVGAIDLHAHHGPDAYPRQWDAFEIAKIAQSRGMRAIVIKNHWTETAGLAYLIRRYGTQGIEVFGSVTLDTPVGGMNPQAVRYMADVEGGYGRVVWLPTHDSEHEVFFNKDSRPFARASANGRLLPETLEVLDIIAERNLTLATGHLTPEETLDVMREARRRGIDRIIVTHPILAPQFTYMSIEQMQEAVKLGGYIEVTAGALSRGGDNAQRVINVIRTVGPEHCVVSSDSGLVGTPNHPDALAMAARALRTAGFNEAQINLLLKDNPAKVLGLPVLSN